MTEKPDRAELNRRAASATKLLRCDPSIPPEVALSCVVWPEGAPSYAEIDAAVRLVNPQRKRGSYRSVYYTRKGATGPRKKYTQRRKEPCRLGQRSFISEAEIAAAYRAYVAGASLRELAEANWQRWGYSSAAVARSTLRKKFAGRKLPVRSQSAGMRVKWARRRHANRITTDFDQSAAGELNKVKVAA